MNTTPLQKAIEIAGGQTALADRLGVKQGHVWHWLKKAKKVPAEYVIPIERETGISRHELRPDIYPPEERGIKHAQ